MRCGRCDGDMVGRRVSVFPINRAAEVIRDPGYVGIDGRHWLTVRMEDLKAHGGEPWTFDAPCLSLTPI